MSRPAFDYSQDFSALDFRQHPERYRMGKGEQGVLLVEPYKSEILPHWRFRTVDDAKKSSRMIEEHTAELPSDLFLWAAGGSIVGSLIFQMMGDSRKSLFIGQWAPTFLILGLYNKLVKLEGSD